MDQRLRDVVESMWSMTALDYGVWAQSQSLSYFCFSIFILRWSLWVNHLSLQQTLNSRLQYLKWGLFFSCIGHPSILLMSVEKNITFCRTLSALWSMTWSVARGSMKVVNALSSCPTLFHFFHMHFSIKAFGMTWDKRWKFSFTHAFQVKTLDVIADPRMPNCRSLRQIPSCHSVTDLEYTRFECHWHCHCHWLMLQSLDLRIQGKQWCQQ